MSCKNQNICNDIVSIMLINSCGLSKMYDIKAGFKKTDQVLSAIIVP